LEVRDREK
jgi:hypothetical protein